MADIQPLRALHYDPAVAGPLQDLLAPPYDVIDAAERARLAARSPYNAVAVDLPEGEDPYARAAELLAAWQAEGALVRDAEPALWALEQDYTTPEGATRTRRGFLARVRVEEYGAGRIRPHERTHPGPKEDRLRLTRATRANLSPIFVLHGDPTGAVREATTPAGAPFGEAVDAEGTRTRVWRIGDAGALAAVHDALADSELLIADGHHRYETARAYADEVGGEGPQRYVLACLVALEDPGLSVFPTHRLVRVPPERRDALAETLERDFTATDGQIVPPAGLDAIAFGHYDGRSARLLVLRDPAIADAALQGRSDPYRRLEPAVLEALVLKQALGMDEESISHLDGLGYARDAASARRAVDEDAFDAAFLLRGTPVEQVRAVASAGESMPPKSTYFFPKIPTGLLFNPLFE